MVQWLRVWMLGIEAPGSIPGDIICAKGVGTRGAGPPHYFQKHVLPPPSSPHFLGQVAKVICTHTEIHTSIREAIQSPCKITLWGVASPVHHNCQAIHCTVLNTKSACNFISVTLARDICCSNISWIPCSEKLNSGKSATSVALYDVEKI